MNHFCKLVAMTLFPLGLVLAIPSHAQTTLPAGEAGATARASPLPDLERRAALGDTSAAEMAGEFLYVGQTPEGIAVRRDWHRARGYLSQAAAAGRPQARLLLERIDSSPPPSAPDEELYVPGPYGC